MTTVPQPALGPTGYTEPSVAAILQAVYNDINTAFGGAMPDYSPAVLSTPQGQLATTLAALIADKNDLFLNFVNQVDPLYSQGSRQDAIGLLYFQTRFPATSTSGTCLCTGLPGTVIPVNAQASDVDGNIYLCDDGGTIPPSGSVSLTFANQVTGPIPCLAGNLNKIYVAVPGWSGITNPGDMVEGKAVESSQDFELRRQASVASNALGISHAIRAAVIASGIDLTPPNTPSSVYVDENWTSASLTRQGVTLLPHSVYVAVLGGDPASIAAAILSKKSLGCDYNGNTTVTVTPTGGPPYPVTYEVPSAVPAYVNVIIKNNALLPANIATLIKNAIVALFATPNNTYGQIGTPLYAGSLYSVVTAVAPGVQVISITVGTSSYPSDIAVACTAAEYVSMDPTGASITVGLS